MKILIFINTPAQAHTWKYVIKELIGRGHQVNILAREYDSAPTILSKFGFTYKIYIKPSNYKWLKSLQVIPHVWNGYKCSKNFKPDIILGFGVIEALTSVFFRKPCILFTDSEPVPLQNWLNKVLARYIITPSSYKGSFGKKHIQVESYKEMAYLHPEQFKPDNSIYSDLGLDKEHKYAILRFNAFDAVHDIGRHGFTLDDKYSLVKELSKYLRVFISSEKPLPKDLEMYKLNIPFESLHNALYFATILVTDTQTMATESAILGTPAVRCNNFVGIKDMGNFIELEQRYGLIYSFSKSNKALKKAIDLIKQKNLKQIWSDKRKLMLSDKVNLVDFLVSLLDNSRLVK